MAKITNNQSKEKGLENYTKEQLTGFYRQMFQIRRFEESAEEQYMRGNIRGFLHVYTGQEAVAVGAISALLKSDYLVTHYRDHGHALAKGLAPKSAMAELFGKATGCSKGMGGSMHLFDKSINLMGGYAIVGGQLPIATGLGISSKELGKGQVVMVFMGDGALNEGELHESLNMAAIWNLPVIFYLENNLYGMGNHTTDVFAVKELKKVSEPFGIPNLEVDGMNVLAVNQATQTVVEKVRKGSGPFFIEAKTYRFRGHSVADPSNYRGKSEEETWKKRDPITSLETSMIQSGLIEKDEISNIRSSVEEEIADAVKFALESPDPEDATLYHNVYDS